MQKKLSAVQILITEKLSLRTSQGQGWDMWQTIRFCFILKRLAQLFLFSYKTTNLTQYVNGFYPIVFKIY